MPHYMSALFNKLLVATSFLCSILTVFAAVSNRTIDDSLGDLATGQLVNYQPNLSEGIWRNQSCADCLVHPSSLDAFQGTYTAAMSNKTVGDVSATLTFNGSAIYVFFILANNVGPGIATRSAVNFTLDNRPPQSFLHVPDLTTTSFQFNALVFSETVLAPSQHTLVMSSSGDSRAYVNFDYAIYTHNDNDFPQLPIQGTTTGVGNQWASLPSSTKAVTADAKLIKPGAVAAVVVGTILAGVCLMLAILAFRRRKDINERRRSFNTTIIDPSSRTIQYAPPSRASMNPFDIQQSTTSTIESTNSNEDANFGNQTSAILTGHLGMSAQEASELAAQLHIVNRDSAATSKSSIQEATTTLNNPTQVRTPGSMVRGEVLRVSQSKDEEDISPWVEISTLDADLSVVELNETMRALRMQINLLRTQQAHSPFNEPPPLYTPRVPIRLTTTTLNPQGNNEDLASSPTSVGKWRSAVTRVYQ